MIGRNLWELHGPPRRGVYRRFGVPDLDTRQKWAAVAPMLPETSRSTLLDAGCGPGAWSLELAARHPQWEILGIDLDEVAVERAQRDASRLGLGNVSFRATDYFDHEPDEPVDLVLSVCSAHYLVEDGRGTELFARMSSWLRPGGSLICLVPRAADEVPFVSWLTAPDWHDVLTARQVEDLATAAGLSVEHLSGRVGRLGTVAKQLNRSIDGRWRRVLWPVVYPLALALCQADRPARPARSDASMFWLLVARAG